MQMAILELIKNICITKTNVYELTNQKSRNGFTYVSVLLHGLCPEIR
jgi:hypothetical protein